MILALRKLGVPEILDDKWCAEMRAQSDPHIWGPKEILEIRPTSVASFLQNFPWKTHDWEIGAMISFSHFKPYNVTASHGPSSEDWGRGDLLRLRQRGQHRSLRRGAAGYQEWLVPHEVRHQPVARLQG